ncbi:EsaB/YukD family protein [uncultured Eubacterium sp.]|uniref:EsaB/YukD family protein n=1 Tax=uncultured Eubacterium sp. TaxID=165185 RepID=UPI0025F4DA96|nr:EsaB/YukD family protein [uncultured Eubacterium sp.]
MDHILIKLYVPAIDTSYDIKIPVFLPIMDITQLLAQAVENLSNGEYVSSGSEILSVKNKQLVLFNDQTPADYEIKNGDVLMMM